MLTDHIHDQIGRYRVGTILDSMPEFIKEAEEKIVSENLEKLADGCFAYSDGVNRYFPLHTPEHTWLSNAYFEKFAHTFDEQTANSIKEKINEAYKGFQLPENNFIKEASEEDDIDALHSLSIELNKFIDNYKQLSIENRRKKAKELYIHAKALGREKNLHDHVYRYAGDNLKKDFGSAFAKRMTFFKDGSNPRSVLLKMQEAAHSHIPEIVAKALHLFDIKSGLNKYYDTEIADPYSDLLTLEDTYKDHVIFDDKKIDINKLKSFNYDNLNDILSETIINQLKLDPIETLSNTDPSIRIIIIRRML